MQYEAPAVTTVTQIGGPLIGIGATSIFVVGSGPNPQWSEAQPES